MFTGIIEEIGTVQRLEGPVLTIGCRRVIEGAAIGDSIAIDGACMTVIGFDQNSFTVQVSPESFERTTLGSLKEGAPVNIERAMAAGDRFGGHFVQGHVDAVGRVVRVEPQGEFQVWTFQAPPEVAKYLVPKGSVTVDGISLTVVNPAKDEFSVAVIPETLRKTKLGSKKAGDPVNLEADVFGKHIVHYLQNAVGGSVEEMVSRFGAAD